MTNWQKGFVLAAALVLALTVGGGAASAQDGEIVGIEYSYSGPGRPPGEYSITRFNIDRTIGSAQGVTVDLAANTVRLNPGKYWFSAPNALNGYGGRNYPFIVRAIPAVQAEDSTGTTVEIIGTWNGTTLREFLVVVNGDGATRDDVKLGTVGRRVDFSVVGNTVSRYGNPVKSLFIRRLGD